MLKRRAPLKQKRETPRRNEGRVAHGRMKEKRSRGATAEEREHMDRVASLGCLLTGRPAELHHIMHMPGKARRRDHRFVVPLSSEMHRGTQGVHGLGSEAKFLRRWGVDLAEWATDAWNHRNDPEGRFWTDSVMRCRMAGKEKGR